jgi:hypothetical protein
MQSNFRNPTILVFTLAVLAFVDFTSGKSIIRELLDSRMLDQFVPDRSAARPYGQANDINIEQCRVSQNKELSTKLDGLCDECFQLYRKDNFYNQCRKECFNNNIIRGCALAMFRQTLMKDFDKFLETEVAVKGNTIEPTLSSSEAPLKKLVQF